MTAEEAKDALRSMMLIRAFEEALAEKPDHGFQLLSTGEEAVAVGICSALSPDDQLLTGGRSIGPALARGCDPRRVIKCKVFMELQPICRTWNPYHCRQPIRKTRSGNKAAEKLRR